MNYYYTHFDRLIQEIDEQLMPLQEVAKKQNTIKLPSFPPCDCLVSEDRNTLSLRFAMAGYDQDSVEVIATASTISVKAEPQRDDGEALAYIHSGISKKAIDFTVAIDESYNARKAKTTFENGMLFVELPIKKDAESVKLM